MARPTAQMPLFEKYWTSAIVPTATAKCDKSWNRMSWIGPKNNRTTMTVSEVEASIIAELNATTNGVLLIRRPENNPSIPARRIPATPPYNNSTRKMKASEIVMLVLTRGIWTEKRELTTIITAARIRNRQSNFGAGSHTVERIRETAPAATMTQR